MKHFDPNSYMHCKYLEQLREDRNMQPYQKRLITERDDLADKWNRLRVFISGSLFTSLAADERLRLRRQERIMEEYVTVLNERIAGSKLTKELSSSI